MEQDLSRLSVDDLFKEYRRAVVYTALSNDGADKACQETEARYEAELRRRLSQ